MADTFALSQALSSGVNPFEETAKEEKEETKKKCENYLRILKRYGKNQQQKNWKIRRKRLQRKKGNGKRIVLKSS